MIKKRASKMRKSEITKMRNMAFITIIKPDYVNPITLISCVMHEEDRVEKLL